MLRKLGLLVLKVLLDLPVAFCRFCSTLLAKEKHDCLLAPPNPSKIGRGFLLDQCNAVLGPLPVRVSRATKKERPRIDLDKS